MEDGITSGDVRKKSIAQPLALGSTLHQTGNIDNIQIRWHFATWGKRQEVIATLLYDSEENLQYLAGLW